MQGEIYTTAPKGKPGLQTFNEADLLRESPDYFVFNGAVDALIKRHPLKAEVDQTVRIFFGDAGPNETSSLHIVGEIFTRDYQLGALQSPPLIGVQTASVPPGGAAILELKASMPGQFTFMDHAMARMAKGLVGTLEVKGQQRADLMHPGTEQTDARQSTFSGLAPAAETISNSSQQPATKADATSSDENIDNTNNAEDKRLTLKTSVDPRTPVRSGALDPGPRHSSGPARLSGCLTMTGPVAKLAPFHSSKSFFLERTGMLATESPLSFADNINKLVDVTGHIDRSGDLYGGDWFIVDSIEQLAPTCQPTQTLAELRRAVKTRNPEATPVSGVSHVVGMVEMAFTPAEITINAGETVVWNNTSFTVHNVVDDAAQALNAADVQLPKGVKPFGSGYLQPNQSFRRTFAVPGVYHYVCILHENAGMRGTIIVKPSRAIHMASAEDSPR